MAVNGERQILQHPLGVGSLLRFRNDAVRIGVDPGNHDGIHGHPRCESHLRLQTGVPYREEGALQVFIQPVRERRRNGQGENRSAQAGSHFAAGFRP